MAAIWQAALVLAISGLFGLQSGQAAKIAFLPFCNGMSHYFMMEKIGQELEARGHEVTYIMCSIEPKLPALKVKKLVFDVPGYPVNHLVDTLPLRIIAKGYLTPSDVIYAFGLLKDICDALLMNEGVLSMLEETDLLFADTSCGGCGQLLKHKTGIPLIVDFSAWGFNDPYSELYGLSWPVSYIPSEYTHSSPKMSFAKRVVNVLFYVMSQGFSWAIMKYNIGLLQHKHGIVPEKSLGELIGETDLLLIPADFAVEWSRPVPPNIKVIGSTQNRPASSKLPQYLEQFMQSAGEQGVILVSFGSMVVDLDDRRTAILVNAFSKLKYKVLWKYKRTFPNITNLKTVMWMPQNDILGHRQIKLFITHGGANSIYEGSYHGVPLLVTPFWGDQFGFAEKVKAAGMGADFNIRKAAEFSAESVVQTINELIGNPKYKTNALRVSKLLKDRSHSPSSEGADWIEYVIRHNGTQHLRPRVLELSFYQYFLLDVFGFLFIIFVIVVFSVMMCCRCVKKMCCSKKKQKDE